MSRPAVLPSSTVHVALHVYESTAFRSHAYAVEDRVTLDVGGSGGGVTLFLPREEITRLRDALDRAERELTVAQDELAAEITAGLVQDSAA